MSDISKSVFETDPVLAEALRNASSIEEMKELTRSRAVEHGAERDRFSPDKLIFDNFKSPTAAAGTFTRTITINGVEKVLVADSELALERMVGAAYAAASAAGGGSETNANTDTPRVQARHPLSGQFIDCENPGVIAELKTLLITGRITPEQFVLAQPQLLDATMKERYNLDPEKIAGDRVRESWAAATKEFLESEAGADWPGGSSNQDTVARLLAENNLTDSPSAETLARVYAHMKIHGLVQENPELANQKEIGEATSFEQLRQAAWKSTGGRPSSFWSR